MTTYTAYYFSSSTQSLYPFSIQSSQQMPQTATELNDLGKELICYVRQFGTTIDFPLSITTSLPEDEFEQLLLDTHYYPSHTYFLSLALDKHQHIVHAESGDFYDLLGANDQMLLYREKDHTTFDVVNLFESSQLFVPIFVR